MGLMFKILSLCLLLFLGFAAFSFAMEREEEYALYIQGERVGVCKITMLDTQSGFNLLYSIEIFLSRMGEEMALYLRYDIFADENANLEKFSYESNFSGGERVVEGAVVSDRLMLNDGEQEYIFEWGEDFTLEPLVYLRLARIGLEEGGEEKFVIFDVEGGSSVESELTVERVDEDSFRIIDVGKTHKTEALVGQFGWLKEERVQVGGIEMSLCSVDDSTEEEYGELDIIHSLRVPLSGEFLPDALAVTYKLNFPPDSPISVATDFRQQVLTESPGEIELGVTAVFGDVFTPLGDEEALLAGGSPYFADDERIVALAEEILSANKEQSVSDGQVLSDWVNTHIATDDYSQILSDALTVLERGSGDCTEHATLLVGLLRSVGIPAKAVIGLVHMQGCFYYHMWIYAYQDGGWITLDPTLGYVSPYHIRFGDVSPQDGFSMEGLFDMISTLGLGQLSITIIAAE